MHIDFTYSIHKKLKNPCCGQENEKEIVQGLIREDIWEADFKLVIICYGQTLILQEK